MTSPAFTQVTHRIRQDNGDETGASWYAAQGDDYTIPVNNNFRIRFRIDETNNRAWNNYTWILYVSYNGGSYAAINGTYCNYADSSYYTAGADCTSQLTGGSGTFLTDNNGMVESGGSSTNSGAAGDVFELEFCLTIVGSGVNNGDTLRFRVYQSSGTALATYTDTPIITVSKTTYTGQLVKTLGALTVDGEGTVAAPAAIVGQLDKTLGALTVDGEGFVTGEIFRITHEGGTTGEYDSLFGTPTVSTNAAIVGSYGLECDAIPSNSEGGVMVLASPPQSAFRIGVAVKRNTYTIGSGEYHYGVIAGASVNGDYNGLYNIFVMHIWNDSGTLRIRMAIADDDGHTHATAYTEMPDSDSFWVEAVIYRESSDGAVDGYGEFWLNGDLVGATSVTDNFNLFGYISRVYFGVVNSAPAGASGILYVDECVYRNDDTAIGSPLTEDINGQADITLGALTVDGEGSVDVTGEADITLGAMVADGAGAVDIVGQLDKTLGALAVDAEGSVDVSGQLDATLGALQSDGEGQVDVSGQLDSTLGALTVDGEGNSEIPAIEGDADITLGALAVDGEGQVDVTGEADITLGAMVADGAGAVDISGQLNITLGALTVDGEGTGLIFTNGQADITLGALAVDAEGSVDVSGQLDATLGALAVDGAGAVAIVGQADIALGALAVEAEGGAETPSSNGQLDATFGALAVDGSGAVAITGQLDATLGALAVDAGADVIISGQLDVTLGALVLVATGRVAAPFTPGFPIKSGGAGTITSQAPHPIKSKAPDTIES